MGLVCVIVEVSQGCFFERAYNVCNRRRFSGMFFSNVSIMCVIVVLCTNISMQVRIMCVIVIYSEVCFCGNIFPLCACSGFREGGFTTCFVVCASL